MARLFYGSVLAGMALSIAAAVVFPLPQHQRYHSSIAVIPDGGRQETFHIQWPQDRIEGLAAASSGRLASKGGAVVLKDHDEMEASVEVFRLRDVAGNVIGLASRSTSRRNTPGAGPIQGVDWILVIPRRGALFMTQSSSGEVAKGSGGETGPAVKPVPGTGRSGAGTVLGGTQEFADLQGSYEESWELAAVAADGSSRGRITLVTRVEALR